MFTGTLVGNVGADAELRYIGNGTPVLNFRVATTDKVKGAESTTWVSVSYFGKGAEAIQGYVKKGKKIGAAGRISNRQYEKDGQVRYSLELNADTVELLGERPSADAEQTSSTAPLATQAYVPSATEPF